MNENKLNIDFEANIKQSLKLSKKARKERISPPVFQFISDIFAVILSFYVQFYITFMSGWIRDEKNIEFDAILIAGAVVLIYWITIFWLSGLYKNWFIRSPFEEFFSVVRTAFVGCFLVFFFILLDEANPSMRMLFLVFFALVSLSVGIGRFIIRSIQKKARTKGLVAAPTLLIGSAAKIGKLYDDIGKNKQWGFKPVGAVLSDAVEIESLLSKNIDKLPILGTVEELPGTLKKIKVKEALLSFSDSKQDHGRALKIVANCYDEKIAVKIDPDLYSIFSGQMRTVPIWGIPLIVISPQLLKPWQAFLKRFIDVVFSSLVILAGLPFWVIIGLIVKLGSKGPVFYAQERVGKGSNNFRMYKFRSMANDAEKAGPQWAKVNDPRVTPFGKFLRKSHLDEIPQFWNVLKGDMSIVGPRPERPVFVKKFSKILPEYKRRLILRPGITGWWQVHYTSYAESLEEIEGRLKDDFYYIENISLKLDLEIVIRTVFAVLKGHGQA